MSGQKRTLEEALPEVAKQEENVSAKVRSASLRVTFVV